MTSVNISSPESLNLSLVETSPIPNIQIQGLGTEVSITSSNIASLDISIPESSVSSVGIQANEGSTFDLDGFNYSPNINVQVDGIQSLLITSPAILTEISSVQGVADISISSPLPANIELSTDMIIGGEANVAALESRVAAVENTVTNFVNKKPTVPVVTASGSDVATSISGNLLSSATDPDGNVLIVVGCSYGATSFSTGATFSAPYGNMVISSNGSYSFLPNASAKALKNGQSATQVFSFNVSDGQGAIVSSNITITIIGANNSPLLLADNGYVPYNSNTTGNVLSNDTDPDQGTLSLTQFVISGDATVYSPGQTAIITGKGSLTMQSNGSYSFTSVSGYSGSVPVVTYSVSNGSFTSTSTLTLTVSPAPTDVISDPVTTALTGTHATYNAYSDSDLNSIPWGSLQAGDVVNIYWKSTPYRAKFALRAMAYQGSPVIVNGVTDANGNRPKFDWGTGAFTAAGCNPSGGFGGSNDIFSTTPAYGEGLGGIVIKRGPSDSSVDKIPSWIEIKNLELTKAIGNYTTLAGTSTSFVGASSYGTGIYFLNSADCTVENCVIYDHGMGIFTQANGEDLQFTSSRIKVRNCRIYGNGVPSSFLEHNLYIQAHSPTIEGCYIGKLRGNSLGSTYKSRSSSEIFRYNWVESSARALDFVQSQDNTNGIPIQPNYGVTWCYGNTIINDEGMGTPQAVNPLHFGGDTGGEQEASTSEWVADTPYKTQLYFWNNTYYQKKTTTTAYDTSFFDLSLRSTRVDAWNNIFYAVGNTTFTWLEMAGILNFRGTNIVYGSTINDYKSTAEPINCSINRIGTIITQDPAFVNIATRDFNLQYESSAIDAGSLAPSGLPMANIGTLFPLEYRHRGATNGLFVRNISGNPDLGAVEYGVGYTPATPPAPAVSVIPSIQGSAVQGSQLSVSNGTWSGRPTFSYQWKRDGVNIPGETSSTFTTSVADFHTTITVTVTGTNPGGSSSSTTSGIYIISDQAPINTVAPVVSGNPTEGLNLSCTTGTWTNSPTGYTYQWLLNGSNIVGATASTYQIQIGQAGSSISCRVTASNAVDSNSQVSNSMTVIAAPSDPDLNGTWNFSAANGTTLVGLSTNWTSTGASNSRYECVNGALQCIAGTGGNGETVYFQTGLPTNDQTVAVKINSGWSGQWRFGSHYTSTQSGYLFVVQPSQVTLYVGGAWTQSYTISSNGSTDIELKIKKVGNTLYGYQNGSEFMAYNLGSSISGGGFMLSLTPGTDVSAQRIDYIKMADV